jgi:flagellar biosynthesis protein FlhG
VNAQAASLRERAAPRAGVGARLRLPAVAVTGGKGGVGKTTLSVNLALALRRLGRRVLLVDCDLGLSSVDALLGLRPERHLGAFLSGEAGLAECLMEGPEGLLVAPAASGAPEWTSLPAETRERLFRGLDDLRDRADLAVLDTAAGISGLVLEPLLHAGVVLLVTVPEPAALLDAYALLKVLWTRAPGTPVGLVVNEAAHPEEAYAAATRLNQAAQAYLGRKPEFWGFLPRDPDVAAAALAQVPFVVRAPEGAAARAVRHLAARLASDDRMLPRQAAG